MIERMGNMMHSKSAKLTLASVLLATSCSTPPKESQPSATLNVLPVCQSGGNLEMPPGINVEAISEQLGVSSISVMLGKYIPSAECNRSLPVRGSADPYTQVITNGLAPGISERCVAVGAPQGAAAYVATLVCPRAMQITAPPETVPAHLPA